MTAVCTFLQHVDSLREAVDALLQVLNDELVERRLRPLFLELVPLLLRLPQQLAQRQVALDLGEFLLDVLGAALRATGVHQQELPAHTAHHSTEHCYKHTCLNSYIHVHHTEDF